MIFYRLNNNTNRMVNNWCPTYNTNIRSQDFKQLCFMINYKVYYTDSKEFRTALDQDTMWDRLLYVEKK